MSDFSFLPEGRGLIEEPSFVEARRTLVGDDVRRFDEMLHGITWRIARDPEGSPEIPGTRLRVAKARSLLSDASILRVFYSINPDGKCSLWSVDSVADESEML